MDLCRYCGMPADEQDHLTPLSVSMSWKRKPGQKARKSGGHTVRSCRSCNAILSKHLLPTVQERAAHIAKRLRGLHARTLKLNPLNPKDLEDMAPGLVNVMRAMEAERDFLLSRIEYLEETARLP